MLPLRTLLRPTRIQPLRQAFSRTLQRPYYYSRPATLGARIWYRPDGTPRSKIRGLVTATLASMALYVTWNTLLVVEELDYERYLLGTLVYIQRVDYDAYPTRDELDTFNGALTYFEELCGYFLQGDVRPEMLEAFFHDLFHLGDEGVEGDLVQLRERIHGLVRTAAEAVHTLLATSKGTDPIETAALAIGIVDDAMLSLIEISEDVGADETEKLLRVKRLREQMKDSSKSYEILG
ncbi:hypothetical protein FB45DRAFT_742359 [Roridomyces roridus]|uniref:Uncharacterized protein n=1 Tax=Roridomyces roridus TaxID=1738132 RepID=A0AAD7FU10_9AGAR|nr:hypothetical protein FB45DRAFT_742359 [Roridomyces roridus]